MSLTFSKEKVPQGGSSNLLRGEGARRADEGLLITLISLAALASFSQEKLKTKLPAGRKNVSHLLRGLLACRRQGARRANLLTFSEGEGARRADEGLLITLISLAALASFPRGS
jgi:Flp pilus assembly pilin Flp